MSAERRFLSTFTKVLLTYAVCGFLTYGVIYNSIMQQDCGIKPQMGSDTWDYWWDCSWRQRNPDVYAIVPAVVWIFYWPGQAAVWITR